MREHGLTNILWRMLMQCFRWWLVFLVERAQATSHNARATQARWSTFLNQIQKKLQREREAREAEAREAEEETGASDEESTED